MDMSEKGSQLCSATPRQWLCPQDVPQFFASPLEAGQGLQGKALEGSSTKER